MPSTTTNESESSVERPSPRLSMLSSSDGNEYCRTFIFKGESHTLGNALKNVIIQNPAVSFCGYSIPHPAEDQMFLRIQTKEGGSDTAADVLKQGFKDLKKMCAVTRDKFNKEKEEFLADQPKQQ